ncbi:MAG: PTS sugar transporter subunit IIB [Alkalibacterium sp.]|nr:PTS sugar transporter subunit IIB [Alkalibacterium sp.]
MMNILLVCSAGMSTSMLVKKMQEAAENKGLEANIWAVGDSESQEESKKADIVLLGPQVKYLESKMKERVNNEKPVSVIDMRVYGTMNGAKALDNALEVYEKFEK